MAHENVRSGKERECKEIEKAGRRGKCVKERKCVKK
jgi:hypothetical protein